jgi:hypothetical protein
MGSSTVKTQMTILGKLYVYRLTTGEEQAKINRPFSGLIQTVDDSVGYKEGNLFSVTNHREKPGATGLITV